LPDVYTAGHGEEREERERKRAGRDAAAEGVGQDSRKTIRE
jgi:hypothetical protein